ncbi:MAG: Ig-like domain-containing protein [Methanobacteriota archaeon]
MDMGDCMRFKGFIAAAVGFLVVSSALMAVLPGGVAGAVWSTNTVVNEPSGAQQKNPSMTAGPDGILHFAWVDNRNGGSGSDIFYSMSGDNGTSFLYPNIEVSEGRLSGYTHGAPDIAVNASGTAFVAWHEFNGQDTNVRVARKTPFADAFQSLGIIHKVTDGSQDSPSISSGGSSLAVAWKDGRSDNLVRIWDSETGALVKDLAGHNGSVTSVAFSPDGKRLASSSESGIIKVWNATSGALLSNLTGHLDIVTCVAWSPDGSKLASSSWDHTVKIWSAADYALVKTLSNSNNPVNSVDWSPDGALVVAGYNGEGIYTSEIPGFPNSHFNVTVWNVASGTATLVGVHNNSVNCARFSPDGAHIASSSGAVSDSSLDNSIRIWNAGSLSLVSVINVAGGYVNSVSWGQNGMLAAGVENGSVTTYWNPAINNTARGFMSAGPGAVKATDWLASGQRIATGGMSAIATVWNSSSAARVAATSRGANTIHGVSLSPDGRFLATGSGNSALYRRSESHVYCAVSVNGGVTWPIQTRVDSVGAFELGSPSVSIGANGDIGVAWWEARNGGTPNIYYANSTDGGATFAQDTRLSGGGGAKFDPSIALDEKGVGHVAWHDERDKDITGYLDRFDIYYGRSDSPGVNVRVNATAVDVQQQSADIDVSKNGSTVAIVWVEDSVSIKVAQSNDGGASFGLPSVISDTAVGVRYLPTVVIAGGHVHAAWEDYRRGDSNVYFSSTVQSDEWPPSVIGVQPAPGAATVSAYSPIVVKFSEPVKRTSFESAFRISDGTTAWTAENLVMTWSAYGNSVSLEPFGWHLSYYRTYTATISATVEDMKSNVMAAPYSWTFSTGSDLDGPLVKLVSAPAEVDYGATATVMVSVVEYTGIANITLTYKLNGTGAFASTAMVVNSVHNYEAAIPAQGVLGTIVFYVWASDTLGNIGTLPANLSADRYLEIKVVDRTPPEISHTPVESLEFDREVTVSAIVTDGIGVTAVSLEYNTVSSDVVHVSNMTNGPVGSDYTGTLPVQGNIGTYSYRIVATDSSNNTASTSFYNVLSVDLQSPTLTTPVASQQSDGSILITVTASDNHELASVTLHFIPVGGSRYIQKDMSPAGPAGEYSATILEQEQTGTFKFYVNATDPSGNSASSLSMNDGKPYSLWVEGKLPPLSVILVISLVVIAIGLAALVYLLRRRRRRPRAKSGIVGQPEHPLESVNVPVNAPQKPGKAPPAQGKPPKAG